MQIEQLNVQPFDCIPWSATTELQQFWPHMGYAYKTLSHRNAKLCSEVAAKIFCHIGYAILTGKGAEGVGVL